MKTKAEQIEDLKTTAAIHMKVADKLQQQIEALEKPDQWEPRYQPSNPSQIKAKVTHNRLLAYVREFGGGWEADWANHKQPKYCVYYDYYHKLDWCMQQAYATNIGGTVYMSQECAEGLLKKLNSGEVVL